MMNNNPFNEIALQLIKSSAFCPICSNNGQENVIPKKNQSINAQILEKDESQTTFYLKCNNCNASMISIISTSDNNSNGIVFMTDLNPQEVLSFKKNNPINLKDVKEIQYLIHNNLNK